MPFDYLPLYYCYSCRLCLGHFYYRLAQDGSIDSYYIISDTFLGNPFESVMSNIPESNVLLIALLPEEQAYYTSRDMVYTSKCRSEILPELSLLHMNQIGGFPWLYDDWSTYDFVCPICEEQMPFFAKFNTTTPNRDEICGELETPELIFSFCMKCFVVGAMHRNYC